MIDRLRHACAVAAIVAGLLVMALPPAGSDVALRVMVALAAWPLVHEARALADLECRVRL